MHESTRCLSLGVLILVVTLFPNAGAAHTLDAPASVQADANGNFTYEITFTAGPGTALLAAASWFGLNNVPGGFVGDCFCVPTSCLYQEGESFTFPVDGTLSDPGQTGTVQNLVELCGEPVVATTTAILPFTQGACSVNCPAGDADGVQTGVNRSPDIDASGAVGLTDLALFALAFMPNPYSACVDFNCDAVVNLADLSAFALHYGHAGPANGVCN